MITGRIALQLCAIATLGLLAVVASKWANRTEQQLPFDSQAWKAEKTNGTRAAMVDDLTARFLPSGTTVDSAIEQLGEADRTKHNGEGGVTELDYRLGAASEYGAADPNTPGDLCITFDDNQHMKTIDVLPMQRLGAQF